MRKYFTLLLTLIISITIYSQKDNSQLEKAQEQLGRYNEIYFKFPIKNKTEIKSLPSYIYIDNKTKTSKNTVYAYVSKKHYGDLLALNIPFEVVSKGAKNRSLTMATTVAEMANWDRYPTYSVYTQMMQDFATNHPEIARLETIGTSQEGRLIQVLKITDNPDTDEDEPEFFYTGQMHGDELIGQIVLLRLIDYLLENYGTISQVTDLVNGVEIWINPLSNPDGLYNGGNNTVSGAMRSLANGIDPNRNFPAPGDAHPDGEAYAPETQAMMDFADAHHITLSANIHSGTVVVNYPWDTWESSTRSHVDDNWWQFVSHEYADTAQANSTGDYFTDYDNGITEGGDWYVIWGGRQDYMTYFKQGREFTLELTGWKMVDAEDLPDYWDYNYNSLLKYMEQSLYGIRGIITDSVTGEPLKAKVEIVGYDDDNSFVFSTEIVGDYHRLIKAGNYNLTYSKEGYDSQTINLNVTDYNTTVQDVALHPIGAGINENTLLNVIDIYPNPVSNQLNINTNLTLDNLNLTLLDSRGRSIMSMSFSKIDKNSKYTLELPELNSGIYFLKFQSATSSITKRIIKN